MKHLSLFLLMATFALMAFAQVENGTVPTGTPITLTFTEEIRFGADEDDDAYIWPLATTDFAVDKAGYTYVANTKDNRISQFDKAGKFVKDIAVEGEGPGELRALISFQILADGSGVALEGKPGITPTFLFYDKDMKFVKKAPQQPGAFPVFAYLAPDGETFGARVLTVDVKNNELVTRFGLLKMADGSFIQKLSEYRHKADYAQFGNPAVLSGFIGDILKGQYAHTGHYAYDDKGNVYTAVSNKYEITKWSADLSKKELVFGRKYKPQALSEDEVLAAADSQAEEFRGTPFESLINDAFLEKVAKRADLPPVKAPVAGLIAMPDGHLLVVHGNHWETGEQTADIFDVNGVFKGQVTRENWAFVSPVNQPRTIFRNGLAYVMETDEEGDNRMVRYNYKLGPVK